MKTLHSWGGDLGLLAVSQQPMSPRVHLAVDFTFILSSNLVQHAQSHALSAHRSCIPLAAAMVDVAFKLLKPVSMPNS